MNHTQLILNALRPRLARFIERYGDDTAKTGGLTCFNGRIGSSVKPGETPASLGARVRQFLSAAVEQDPEAAVASVQAHYARLRSFYDREPGAAAALNALRIENISNFIHADAEIYPLFFEVIELGPNERMMFRYETVREEVTVAYMGPDGQMRHTTITPSRTEVLADLYRLATEELDYRPLDIYEGDVAQATLRTIDLAADWAAKADTLALTAMGTAVVASGVGWTTTGTKSARHYVPHSGIVTSNLPTHNDQVVTGSTTSTKFRTAVFDAATRYTDSWGKAFPDLPDQRLSPTGIVLVPSIDSADLLAEFPPSTSADNVTSQSAMRTYTQVSRGRNWTVMPTNKLASGKCWVQTNAPVGVIMLKPSQDQMFDTGAEIENLRKNKASRQLVKVFNTFMPKPWNLHALRLTYKTDE